MWRIIVVVALFSGPLPVASGKDIFVNNVTGDDKRDGSKPTPSGKRAGPFRTIQRGLNFARKGDRVFLANAGQPYRESVTIQAGQNSGVLGRPFEIVGNGAVLDGSRPVPKDAWEYVSGLVFRFRPPKMRHQVVYLDGKPAERQRAEGGSRPPLKPLQWCLVDRHVYFCTEQGKLPREYDMSYTALPVGITIYEARHVVVRDLVIQGFQLDGVNAHDGVFYGTLAGLTCRGNGRSGISIGGASRVKIVACLVGDNGTAQVRTEGYSHAEIVNCDLLDKSAPPLVSESTATVVVQKEL